MKPEILYYVLFVRFPLGTCIKAVEKEYPNDFVELVVKDNRGVVYRIKSPLPDRMS